MCKQHSNVLRRQESIIIGYFWFTTFFLVDWKITFHYAFICKKKQFPWNGKNTFKRWGEKQNNIKIKPNEYLICNWNSFNVIDIFSCLFFCWVGIEILCRKIFLALGRIAWHKINYRFIWRLHKTYFNTTKEFVKTTRAKKVISNFKNITYKLLFK